MIFPIIMDLPAIALIPATRRAHALSAMLETQNIIDGEANITLISRNSGLLAQQFSARIQGHSPAP